MHALVPDHVARTLSASPSLYWYLSADTDLANEFVLNDQVSVDPLLTLRLPPPLVAGIRGVDLAAHDIVLEPGKEYRWFVSLSTRESESSGDLVARGAILRIAPDGDLLATLESDPFGERGRIYAERGLWYDALAFISRGVERAPQDVRLRELRAGLLEQGGLLEAADYDRDEARTSASP